MKKWKLTIGVVSSIIIPTAVVISCGSNIKQNENKKEFLFDNHFFKNKKQMKEFLKENYKKTLTVNNNKWTLFNGYQNKYFSSLRGVYNELDKNIDEKMAILPKNKNSIMDYHSGRIYNFPIEDSKDSIQEIFKGANGNYYLNEKNAIESFVQTHQAYKFNGIYFRNEDALKKYLIKNMGLLKDSSLYHFNALKEKGGHISERFSSNTKANEKIIGNFLKSYAKVKYKTINYGYKNAEDLSEQDINERDIHYWTIDKSNNRYKIDISRNTPGTLKEGPNILKTEVNPKGLITDINQWVAFSSKKITKSEQQKQAKIRKNKIKREFQTSALNIQLSNSIPKNAKYLSELIVSKMPKINSSYWQNTYKDKIKNFTNFKQELNDIKINIDGVEGVGFYDALIKTEEKLKQGKSYNFFSISLLRSWMIDKAIYNSVSNKIMDKINEAFDFAMKCINVNLHKKIDFLLSDKAKKFDISNIFNFKYKRTYGESPKIYPEMFRSGQLIGLNQKQEVPEATEIMMASGISIGLMDEIKNQHNKNIYNLPSNFDKLLSISDNQFESSLLKLSLQIWKDFIKSKNITIFKPKTEQYIQFKNNISQYLLTQQQLWNKYKRDSNLWDSFEFFLKNTIKSIEDATLDVADFLWEHRETLKKTFDLTMDITAALFSAIPVVGSIISAGVILTKIGVDLMFGFVEAIVGTKYKDEFEYIHNDSSKQKFIWNGGSHTVHKFLGINILPVNKTGLSALEIIEPVKIKSASEEKKYYYNGKKFTNIPELKKSFIENIKNHGVKNEKVKIGINLETKGEIIVGDMEKLIKKIQKMYEEDNSIASKVVVTNSGVHLNKKGITMELIEKFLGGYKPLLIVELPDVVDGQLIRPKTYRMPVTKTHWLNNSTIPANDILKHSYWIYDQNISKNTKNPTTDEIIKRFKKTFNIKRKKVMKYDILRKKTIKFEKIYQIESLKAKKVYRAKSFDGEIEMFLNKGSAYRWLLSKMLFTIINVNKDYIFEYKGHVFLSVEEFMNWILNTNGGNSWKNFK